MEATPISYATEFLPCNKITDKRFSIRLPSAQIQQVRALSSIGSQYRRYSSLRRSLPQNSRPITSNSYTIRSYGIPDRPMLDDPEMIKLRIELMESHEFNKCDPEKLAKLQQHLKEYLRHLATPGEGKHYQEAIKARKLMEGIHQYKYDVLHSQTKSDAPLQTYAGQKQKLGEKCQSEVEEFDRETAERLSILEKKQKEEMDSFNESWREQQLRKYRKPSAKLLELWKMEKTLARQEKFEEADFTGKAAASLSKVELKNAQEAANNDFIVQRKQLLQKQAEEIDTFHLEREHLKSILISHHQSKKNVIDNRGCVVEFRQSLKPKIKDKVVEQKMKRIVLMVASIEERNDQENSLAVSILPPLIPPEEFIKASEQRKPSPRPKT